MHEYRVRVSAVIVVVLTITAVSTALAQSTSSSPSATSTISSTADQVKDWTQKQWNAMKREWRKDKAKWDACNQRASDQKLSGKASWSFIYDCMKG